MNTRISRIAAALTGALLCCAVSLAFAAAGMITNMTGTVQVNGAAVQMGASVDSGAQVSTGKGSAAIVKFMDGTTVTLDENSILRIDKYQYDSKAPARGQSEMTLVSGLMKVVDGEIAKAKPENVIFNTPDGKILVKGTAFTVYSAQVGQAVDHAVAVTEGNVTITVGSQQYVVTAGHALLVGVDGSVSIVSTTGLGATMASQLGGSPSYVQLSNVTTSAAAGTSTTLGLSATTLGILGITAAVIGIAASSSSNGATSTGTGTQ